MSLRIFSTYCCIFAGCQEPVGLCCLLKERMCHVIELPGHIYVVCRTVCWNVGFLCRKLRCYWDEIRWQSACWYEWMYVCATGCTRIRPADGVDVSFADAVSARQHWLALHTSCNRATENARPENGGPKRDEKGKMWNWNAGTNVGGGKRRTWKCLNSG